MLPDALYTKPWINRFLLISFFLPPKLQTLLFIVFAVWVGIQAIVQRTVLTNKEWLTALFLATGYLFYLAYLPFTTPALRHIVYDLLERKVALFALPFVFALASKLSNQSLKTELKYFVIANILHGSLVNLMLGLSSLQKGIVLHDHVVYRTAFETVCHIHPTYYGMYICFSIAILLFATHFTKFNKLLLYLMHALLLIFLVLLTPKISMLIVSIIYGGYFFGLLKWTIHKKVAVMIGACVVVALFFYGVPFFQQRIGEMIQFMRGETGNAIDNSVVFRKMILEIDLRLLAEHWLMGMGPAGLQQSLDLAYWHIFRLTGMPIKSYNTHNEWLNQWLCFGLPGLFYFVTVFILHFRRALQGRCKIYIVTTLIILMTCLTENILSRQQGVLFAGLFLSAFWWEIDLQKRVNG